MMSADPARGEIFTQLPISTFAPAADTGTGTVLGGMAVADLNNDGLLDLIMLNQPKIDFNEPPLILANLGYDAGAGAYVFEPAPTLPNSSGGWWASGLLTVGDYDNDGDIDIFASDAAGSGLGGWLWENNLVNNGFRTEAEEAFSFTLRIQDSGLDGAPETTNGIALGDVDADGDLDIIFDDPGGTKRLLINQLMQTGYPEFIVDSTAFPSGEEVNGFDLSVVDVDLDGAIDLMGRSLSSTGTLDILYFNDGSGAFQDATDPANQQATFTTPATFLADGIGTSTVWGDYDNDGDWDLVVQNKDDVYFSIQYYTRFFLSAWTPGGGTPFTFADKNATSEIGVQLRSNTGTDAGGGVIFADFDNDGKLDLYAANASLGYSDNFYLNQGLVTSGKPWQFNDVTDGGGDDESAITAGTNGDTQAVAAADWDNDGDLDLFIHRDSLEDVVLLNGTDQTDAGDQFLRVRATCYGRDCLGAVVQVFKVTDLDEDGVPDVYRPGYPGAPTIGDIAYGELTNAVVSGSLVGMRQVQGGMGIGAASSFILHFGLPDVSWYTVRVLFPGGKVVIKDVSPASASGQYGDVTLSQFVSIDMDDPSEDGDGVPASVELIWGTDPYDLDSDDDGLKDNTERWELGTDPAVPDTDGDGIWDGVELGEVSGVQDMDGEGMGSISGTNFSIFAADADANTTTNPTEKDTDGDGIEDGDEDVNFDGLYDANATGSATEINPLDVDTDDDGLTDGAERNGYTVTDVNGAHTYFSNPRNHDTDYDSLNDGLEVGLQAPMVASADLPAGISGTDISQGLYKVDDDDLGEKTTDPSDEDTDGDNLTDGEEDKNKNGRWDEIDNETDPSQFSSDGGCDGDGAETDAGTDPLDASDDSCADPDGDGCDNVIEEQLGTDPYNADTDEDGLGDCLEYETGTDPTSDDSDADGIPDGVEDANQDGVWDPDETDPRDEDTDADGLHDGLEDKDADGLVGDGESDPRDSDSDDDGLSDGVEDTDINGYIDITKGETYPWNPDSDADGLSDGLELSVITPVNPGTDESVGNYFADTDPSTGTNANQADTDVDGLLDGQEDRNKNGRVDADETDPNLADSDGDGLKDGAEDANANGVQDEGETNALSADSDGDGLTDGAEVNQYGTNPLASDTDEDGLTDAEEVSGTTNPTVADSDGDGLLDGQEDLNKDGVVDDDETDPNQPDTDGDGISDGEEVLTYDTDPLNQDTDGDGISDNNEIDTNCNPVVADTDGDGLLDGEESTDGDCVFEPQQNETNPYDDDTDDDGIMDGPELDSSSPYYTNGPRSSDTDGDGILDGTEVGLAEPQGEDTDLGVFVGDADPSSTTSPGVLDTDGDGLDDGIEDKNFNGAVDEGETDPTNEDTDGDGLTDGDEVNIYGTDPLMFDTDGGCEGDGSEVANGTNAVDNPDDDACADADFDGISNELERTRFHSDPFDADTDDDGILDGAEAGLVDNTGDGYMNGWMDTNGDGIVDTDADADIDQDGLNSILDADSDNDGVLDGTEFGLTAEDLSTAPNPDGGEATDLTRNMFIADADPTTTTNPLDADTDDDGVDDGGEDPNHNGRVDSEELDPNVDEGSEVDLGPSEEGVCAFGSPAQDSDCDGLTDAEEDYVNLYRKQIWLDPMDADSDDDGVLDGDEANWSIDSDGDLLINARDVDSDNDGILDGTEQGISLEDDATDSSLGFFIPDEDPGTTTSMVNSDTDFGGTDDGAEDPNHNGLQELDEENPDQSELNPNDRDDDVPAAEPGKTAFCQEEKFITWDQDCDGLSDLEEIYAVTFVSDPDSDDDGLLDGSEDNWSVDMDFDGTIGVMDSDSDNDTIFDGTERGVTDPALGTNTGAGAYRPDIDLGATRTCTINGDTDGGGRADGAEDSNQDGDIGDGETNPNDPLDDCEDDDTDRLCNEEEEAAGTDPNDRDSDNDGVLDFDEGTRDIPWNGDCDGDGLINALDPDSDNDGILDGTETGLVEDDLDPDTDVSMGFFLADADPATTTRACLNDSDKDGVDDGAEDPNHNGSVDDDTLTSATMDCGGGDVYQDSDCDGLTDDEERYQQSLGNMVSENDADSDEDGVLDGDEDNWAVDMDGDERIDALDADSDGDGLLDGTESGLTISDIDSGGTSLETGNFVEDVDPDTTTYMVVADSDRDGIGDGDEDCNRNGANDCVESDPNDIADPALSTGICTDFDADGLTNNVENIIGTDPEQDDSDGDGIPDYVEVGSEADCYPEWVLDTDSDGIIDANDPDSDGDGLLDTDEAGDNPNQPVTTGACDVIDEPYNPSTDLPDYRNTDSDDDGLEDGDEADFGTDPYECDTDGGGVDDGLEILVYFTSPFDGADDGTGIRGGGCNLSGQPGRGGGAGLLMGFLLTAALLRRRRQRLLKPDVRGKTIKMGLMVLGVSLLPFLGFLFSAPTAQAQSASVDRFNAQNYRPALDQGGYFSVWDSSVLRQWHVAGGVSANYVVEPLARRGLYDGVVQDSVVDYMATTDVFAGIGLTNFVSFHMSIPVSCGAGKVPVIDNGTGVTMGYESYSACSNNTGPAFGDAWLAAKLQILNIRRSAIGLALIPEFSLPVGTKDYFFAEVGPTFRTTLATEIDLGLLYAGINVGYRFANKVKVQDILLDDTLDYGIATKVPILEGLDLSAELVGSFVARNFSDEAFNPTSASRDGSSPMEFLLGGHYVSDMGLVTTLGGGIGLNRGAGAPKYRVFAGFGYRSPLNLDEDGDGIPDRFDKCPKDPENFNGVMDEDGCPEPDTDSDSIVDPVDACPTAAEDFDGFQDEDGCPDLDNDADGIPDAKDQCPGEPEDKDGYTDADGCPDIDNDSDGLLDDSDRCPNQAEDFDGFEDDDGCPDLDNDGDGLLDGLDKCPNDAEDKDGFEDKDGCPDTDNDGDGILDANDQCPNEAEVINGVDDEDGCPDEGTQLVFVKEDRLVILNPVHFEVNKAIIRADSEILLNQVATTIRANPYIKKIRIEGHTDSDGDDNFNMSLSQARAESVVAYMVKHGVDPERLEAVGYGETRPIASNRTLAGKGKNRRVDFIIIEREERIRLQKKRK